MRRIVVWSALLLVAVAIAIPVASAWVVSGWMLHPEWYDPRTPEQGLSPRRPLVDPMSAHGLAFEEVEVPAVDGSTLRGWFIPGRKGAVAGIVAVHGGGADRRQFLATAPLFFEAGYPQLLFDCREQGISDSRGLGVGFAVRESADTSAAVAFMKRHAQLERVAVIGSSQGAASAIIAAALDPEIDVVIAENSFTDLHAMLRDTRSELGAPPAWLARLIAFFARVRLDAGDLPSPIEAVAAIAPRPLLLMHGSEDVLIPPSHSEALLAAAGPGAKLWIAAGAEHSQLHANDPTEWRNRVISFLAETLGPAGPRPSVAAMGAEILKPFKVNLKAALVQGMSRGPVEAIAACRVKAPEIASGLSRNGVRVGRTSERLRNPENVAPTWVKPILYEYAAADSERAPQTRSLGDRRAGYVEPIMIQPLCLTCHGETLAPEVSARLAELYPQDAAVGYRLGDLRGVFWAEFPKP